MRDEGRKCKSNFKPAFSQTIVNKIGDVEDILGDFLEQQIKTFENSEDILNILKSFVSIHGTNYISDYDLMGVAGST